MDGKKTPAEMLGEFVREAAVLLAVFIPLDTVLRDKPLTIGTVLGTIVVVGIILTLGILIEVRR